MAGFQDSITVISFGFPSFFPSSREQIQINLNQTKQIVVSWVVSCVSFHMRNLGKYKGSISPYCRGYSNILLIFKGSINIFQRLPIFSISTYHVLAVGLLELCPFRWRNLEPWNYSRMNFPFPNIVADFLIFWYFSDSVDIFQRLPVFSSSRDQILAVWLVWGCVTLCWVFWDLGI